MAIRITRMLTFPIDKLPTINPDEQQRVKQRRNPTPKDPPPKFKYRKQTG